MEHRTNSLTDHSASAIGRHDLYSWMTHSARYAFERAASVRIVRPGEFVYHEGDPGGKMFRILSGSVRMFTARADGREFVYANLERGDCFGISEVIDEGIRHNSAVAQTCTEVQTITTPQFNALRIVHHTFDTAVVRLLARQVRALTVSVSEANLEPPQARLARILVSVANRDEADRLVVNLPQMELASMLGVSRQTVNKILRGFETSNLVQLSYGSVLVHREDKLRLIGRVGDA